MIVKGLSPELHVAILHHATSASCCFVAQLCLILCDPMDCSLPGSSVHEISRQEYWRGLPFPSPGDLPDPGIETASPALPVDSLPLSH